MKALARPVLFLVGTVLIWTVYLPQHPPSARMDVRHIERVNGEPVVAITIDDGPHPLTTPLILQTLKGMDVKVTFFVVGQMVRTYPELARRMVADGHVLGNHTDNHLRLTTLPPEKVAQEIERGFQAVDAVQPQPRRLFRPPGGRVNNVVLNYLRTHDITLVLWSHNPGDWALLPPQDIAAYVDKYLQPGDILLLHDEGVSTCLALPHIIRTIRKRGYRTVTIPEMLALQAAGKRKT